MRQALHCVQHDQYDITGGGRGYDGPATALPVAGALNDAREILENKDNQRLELLDQRGRQKGCRTENLNLGSAVVHRAWDCRQRSELIPRSQGEGSSEFG